MKAHLSPLLCVAIGDAYALPFEYRKNPYSWAPLNDGAHYERHTVYPETCPLGSFSDDTQLSIAMAEAMLSSPVTPITPLGDLISWKRFDDCFIQAFQRNPNAGYSKGMKAGFEKAIGEDRSIGSVCNEHGKTNKSGAAMRATPLGLLPHRKDVERYARLQGLITHHEDALEAAEAAALATHYMYYRLGPRALMGDFVATKTGNSLWRQPWQGPVGSPGMESTHAALTAVMQATSLRNLLIRSVAFTGDVDTVAAIAMGAGWGYPDLEDDLPQALWDGLENGPYGRDWIVTLDARLQERYPRPPLP